MKRLLEFISALRARYGASFRRKALCIALPGLVIASAVHTIDSVTTERTIARNEIRRRAEVIAHLASRIGELPLLSENPELIGTAIRSLEGVHGVTFVAFYNRDLRLLVKNVDEALSVPQKPQNDLEICISEAHDHFDIYAPVFVTRVQDEISMLVENPFDNGSRENAGWVRIGFSKSDVIRQEQAIIMHGLVIAVILTSAIGGLMFLMFTVATRHLDAVSRALRGMRSGEYPELQVSSYDEIGMIAAEFNKMANAVRDREMRLTESEKRIRTLFDRVEHAVFRIDREGNLLESNPKFVELCGSAPQFGCRLDELPRESGEEQPAYVMRNVEQKIVGAEGKELTVIMSLYPEYDEQGNVISYDGYFVDISEKKKLEEGLIQTQKLESIGLLAGGIAHDFNNILGIIIGYADMARLEVEEGSTLRNQLQQVLQAAYRAKELVKQILAFSRRSDQNKQPVQMGILVKEVLKMLRATLPSTIEIRSSVPSKAVVMADPTQIHQVVMNLCTNASHAMRERGGILDVSLHDVHFDPDKIKPLGLEAGPHVALTVKDSGHGIDPAIMDRIFDPFFTTKAQGEGTGLGLSVVHGIVKSHGGAIEVQSVPDKGTTFEAILPARENVPMPGPLETAPLSRGRGRILVVDDEPELAMVLKQMLEILGYQVDFRTNGIEALEAFRHQPKEKPYDLVITDMTMPHLTGVDLARDLLKIRAGLPIILCTGFSEKIDADKAESIGIYGLLMKPVIIHALAGMVREAMMRK